ncbi:MAG: response regulator transcription factor [Sedimentisphaerales bacterium]|nr:response regulator transcription factor [Sedimentisphaerales bacterium]
MNSAIRILLVDDHYMVRIGLASSLSDEPDMKVVGQAESIADALTQFRQLQPDVTLLDLQLPDGDGSTAIGNIRKEYPAARIIVLSVNETEEDIHRAVLAGAAGYLPKSIAPEKMLAAIRAVYQGDTYFPSTIAARLMTRQNRQELTAREVEVLHLLVRGRSNKEIASDLNIATRTVKLHVGHILQKLSVLDRTQAVTAALQRGLVRLH